MEGLATDYPENDTYIDLKLDESCEFSIKFVIEGMLILIIGVIGMFGNTMGIAMFSGLKERQLKFHRLMILLFVYDNAYILLSILVFSLPQLNEVYKVKYLKYVAPTVLPLVHISLTGSVYSTVAISLERYLVVCKPFFTVSHKPLTTKMSVSAIVAFSIIYNIPKFLELKTCYGPEEFAVNSVRHTFQSSREFHLVDKTKTETQINCTEEGYKATDLRLNSKYYSIYCFWMNLLFMGVIPYLTLVILNTRMINDQRLQLKRQKSCSGVLERNTNAESLVNECCCIPLKPVPITKKNQMLLAKTNLGIVLTFILCHSLRWIPNIYEFTYNQMYDTQSWIQSVEYISHLLITLSSSVIFYIYGFTHFNLLTKRIKRSVRSKQGPQQPSNVSFNADGNEAMMMCEEVELPWLATHHQNI